MAPASNVTYPVIGRSWLTARKPLTRPSDVMVDGAHEAVWFDGFWAINSRADLKKAVRAMIRAACSAEFRHHLQAA
jgi:hypothetical protein